MACDINKVLSKVNDIIDSTIIGSSKSIVKNKNRFIIAYGSRYNIKDRDSAYQMATRKITEVNSKLTEAGYASSFGPYVELDQSYSDRLIIHKRSLDKLSRAYELRNKAEQDAQDLSELYNEVYGTPEQIDSNYAQARQQYEDSNNLGDEIYYDVDTPTDSIYTSLINNRKILLSQLRYQRKIAKTVEDKSAINRRINYISKQLLGLTNEAIISFDQIVQYAKSDLDSVKRILEVNPSKNTIDYSYALISNYSEFLNSTFENVINDLEGDDRTNFFAITGELENLAKKLTSLALSQADSKVNQLTGQTVLDINGNLVSVPDIPSFSIVKGSRYLSDITEINNPLVQAISKLIKKATNTTNILYNKFRTLNNKLITDLVKFQKDKGIDKDHYYDYMIQTDNSGKRTGHYVSKYSTEYYKEKSNSRSNKISNYEFMVNNHEFKINEKAVEQYKRNLELDFESRILDNIELTDRDKELGRSYEDKVSIIKNKFMSDRDPNTMLLILNNKSRITKVRAEQYSRYEKSGGMNSIKIGEEYIPIIEAIAHNNWIDTKYTNIVNMSDNDPRKIFYNHFTNNARKSYSKMQSQDNWLDSSYIPEKSKKGNLLAQGRDYVVNSISQNISQKVQIKDPTTGDFTNSIPKYMVGKNLAIEDKSFDLGDILNDFYRESIRFSEMYSIEDDVQYMLSALKKVPTYAPSRTGKIIRDENGDPILKKGESDLYRMVLYTVQSQLYNERQKVEGETKWQFASASVKKKMQDIESELDKISLTPKDKDIANKYVLNDTSYDGSNQDISKYVELGRALESQKPLMKTITGTKIGNSLMGFTAFRLIGFSLFGGIGEFMQGLYSLNLAASGNKWFDGKYVISSMGEVIKSMNPGSTSKVKNLSKYFDVVSDQIVGAEMQKSKLTDAAFIMYKGANYVIHNTYLVALLKSKTISDNSGGKHSLYDVLDVDINGNFNLPDNFDNPYKNDTNTPTEAQIELMEQYKEMIKDNRERRSSDDPIELESTFLGRAVGQFKKNWMIRGFMIRFQDYTEYGDYERKGFYRSLDAVFKLPTVTDRFGRETSDKSFKGVSIATINTFNQLMRFGILGKVFNLKPDENLSELDISNLKMFVREATWGLTMLTFIAICSSMTGGNDDDDNLPFYKYVINQSTRLLRDITTYASPTSFMSLTKNPMPFMNTVSDMFTLGTKVLKSPLLLSPEYSDSEDLHLLRKVEDMTPAIRQVRATYNKIDKIIQYKD